MFFEWDPDKNDENVRKHGIDFADVPNMFAGPLLCRIDDRLEYGEDRWIGVGWLSNIVAVIVFSNPQENTIRIISARRATSNERQQFEQEIKDRLG